MERLKHETRDEHLALEARVPLLRPGLTRTEYAQVVQAFARVVWPLERRLAPLPWPEALKYPARRHTPALRADLKVLGVTAPDRAVAEHPLPTALGTRLPAAYGALYVLEGSTLGGQLISRHLQKHLHLDAGTGAAYFSGYGPDTGKTWQAFQRVMLDTVQPEWHAAIVQEARTTFRTFGAAMSALRTP